MRLLKGRFQRGSTNEGARILWWHLLQRLAVRRLAAPHFLHFSRKCAPQEMHTEAARSLKTSHFEQWTGMSRCAVGGCAMSFSSVILEEFGLQFRRQLLREVSVLLGKEGWRVINIDATIIAQAPKMAPHIPAMIANIASDLKIALKDVNIKAKTAEKLGFVGREEGIVVEAIACIKCLKAENRKP